MSTKIKTIDDCASGLDYYEYGQAQGWRLTKNGSYWEMSEKEYYLHFPNCNRTLPKETRRLINATLIKMGLLLAVVVAVLVACGAAWIH